MAKGNIILGSFNPDEMASGGGLASNFFGEVTDAAYVRFDYRGKGDPVVAVKLTIRPDEGHSIPEDALVDGNVEEIYKAADISQWAPVLADGETIVNFDEDPDGSGPLIGAIGDQKQLNRNSKWGEFIGKALDAGMPKELAGTDLRKVIGIYGHWDRVVSEAAKRAQERDAKDAKGKGGGEKRKYATEVLLLSKFEELRTGKGKGKAAASKPAGKTNGSVAAASDNGGGDDDLNDRVASAIVEALGENDGSIKKAVLGSKIIGKFAQPEKKAVLQLAGNVDFLTAGEMWAFDAKSGVVSSL